MTVEEFSADEMAKRLECCLALQDTARRHLGRLIAHVEYLRSNDGKCIGVSYARMIDYETQEATRFMRAVI